MTSKPKNQSGSPLEQLIIAGDFDGTVAFLASFDEDGRHKLKKAVLELAKPHGANARNRARDAAVFLCGTSSDVMRDGLLWGWNSHLSAADFVALWKRFQPRAIEGLVEAFLKQYNGRDGGRQCILFIQALILAGLIERPIDDRYFIMLVRYPYLKDSDPGLRQGSMVLVFEAEGALTYDAYGDDDHWHNYFLSDIDRGIYSRSLLLDKTLGALEKGWSEHHSRWYSHFHRRLAPSAAEMQPFVARYLGLCQRSGGVGANVAIKALLTLYGAGFVKSRDLFASIPPVFSATDKNAIETGVELFDQVLAREPATAQEAGELLVAALANPKREIQKAVITRLATWGMNDASRTQARALLPQVVATERARLAELLGEAKTAVAARPPQRLNVKRGVLPALDESRRIHPIEAIDELIERTAYVLENNAEIDEFERVLDGLLRFVPGASVEVLKRFEPVCKRARALKPGAPDYLYKNRFVGEMARLLIFLFDGEKVASAHSVYAGGSTVRNLLARRIDDLMEFAAQGKALSPLPTPTHMRGFIAPEALIERIKNHMREDARSSLGEVVLSLQRLAPGEHAQALRLAQALPANQYTLALRYALGDDVPLGDQRELYRAAATIRFPGIANPGLVAACQSLGYADTDAFDMIWRRSERDEGVNFYAATLIPSSLEPLLQHGASYLAQNVDWGNAEWANVVFLKLLLDPTVPLTEAALKALVLGLGTKEPGHAAVAVDALIGGWQDGRLNIAACGAVLKELLSGKVSASRLQKTLQSAARAHEQAPRFVFDLLCAAFGHDMGPVAKDIAKLLELLLELAVELHSPLPEAAYVEIGKMQLSGKGKALQGELLSLSAR